MVMLMEEKKSPQISVPQEPEEIRKAPFLSRAINFIVDVVVFRAIMALTLDQLFSKQFMERQDFFSVSTNDLVILIAELGLYILYFFIFEALFQKTPGKFLTRTRVARQNGERPKITSILLRSVFRFIPFEIFSASVRDRTWWHDRLSRTIVVEDYPAVKYSNNDSEE